jgi:NAD(P)-dependent dehydrogenase (short-subunit alcohol dehydrogenase family)
VSGIRTYEGAVAVVTGGGSGIGAALSRALARRGAIVVVADRDADTASEVASAITASGGRAEPAQLDVRDADAVERVIADVHARHGRIDFLFSNAGIGVGGEALALELDDWRTIVEVNLMGVVHGIRAAYPRMVAQGFGHLVNTASMAGLMATPMTAPYGATKHAVVGLSRALRVEAAVYGVRVSALCPGVIRTPILLGGRHGRVRFTLSREQQLAAWERLRPMDPDRFAEATLDELARNREIVIVPSWWKLVWWLNRLAPALAERFANREYRKMKADVDAAARGG